MESQFNASYSPGADTLANDKPEVAYALAEAEKATEEELRNMQQEFTKHHKPIVETVQHAKTVALALYWEESDMEGLVQEVGHIDMGGSGLSF